MDDKYKNLLDQKKGELINYLVKKLVGYDILNSEKVLCLKLDNARINNSALKKNINKLSSIVSSQESEIEKLKNEINSKELEIDDLIKKNGILDAKNKSKQGTIMNHVKKINALLKDREKIENQLIFWCQKNDELIKLREDYDSILSEKNFLASKIEKIELEKSSIEEVNNSMQEKISSLEKELASSSTKKTDELRELEAQIQNNEETIQSKDMEIDILNIQIQDVKNHFIKVCEELKKIRGEKDSLSEEKRELEIQVKELKDEYDAILKQKSELQEKLISLEQQKEKGQMILNSDLEFNIEQSQSIFVQEEDTTIENQPYGDQNIKQESVNTLKTEVENSDETPEPSIGEDEKEFSKTKRSAKKIRKSKEEKTIEQSGDSIVDFPPIFNDSNKNTQRTIEYVFDENGQIIKADEFFEGTAEEIAYVSRKLSEAEISGKIYWTCGLCHHRVKIAHRTYNGKESLFFIHANRKEYCPWIEKTTSSKDTTKEADDLNEIIELEQEELFDEYKPKSRELKEKIFSLLTSQTSIENGVDKVKMDEIIKSNIPYMRWRRPDISFVLNGRKVVLELQKKSHDIDTIVDRDVFFRLNDIHIIWVFGSDSDTSYDYMRKSTYKNTMFDNHRNVFVFDKEAQSESEKSNTLFLKCNWLDEDDFWSFKLDKTGTNGKLVNINSLTFDDEYCKPYYFDANKDYFIKHPDAYDVYNSHRKTRDELKKDIEEKWTRDFNYEEAQADMRKHNTKATLYCVRELWGFRYNSTIIIPPIFTQKPKDLNNGFYLVQQDNNLGIVSYYGEKIVRWDGFIKCEDLYYDSNNNRLLFMRNELWGVADLHANELIPALYQTIGIWTKTVYRVRLKDKWGLCSTDNKLITNCIYDKIGELNDNRALATKTHPTKAWLTVSGYIDENGQELYNSKTKQTDGLYIVQSFELWGIIDDNDNIILPCQYEEIRFWADALYRVKENDKWGVINVIEKTVVLSSNFDFIGDLIDGVANTKYANKEFIVDINGHDVAQEVVHLQNDLKKTKIAGKWGITNANEEIVVKHLYDEIGSFRSRLIGVINNKLIKLNVNYPYPIYICGKLIKSTGVYHFFSISGVKCILPDSFLKQYDKTISQLCDDQNECKQLAFSNLLFNQQKYLLRILKPESLTKELSHADGDKDFLLGETLKGVIKSFKSYNKMGIKKRTKAMVEFADGRKSMVPRRFFKSIYSIDDYYIGDTITLKKIGFDDELDQTIWKIIQI